MKLDDLLKELDLDFSLQHIKAFFLGAQTGAKPLSFDQAADELLLGTPEAKGPLKDELQVLWNDLKLKSQTELENLFADHRKIETYLNSAADLLDFYLTALALAGTTPDTSKNPQVADFLDELEEIMMEIEDTLSAEAEQDDLDELKTHLKQTWLDYLRSPKR